jgi:hypothetical protein
MAGPNLTSHAHTVDMLLLLKDAGLIAASGAAQVGGSNKILDMGATLPSTNQPLAEFEADVVIDVTAIETDTNNEKYTIIVQGSTSPTFASGIINLCQLELAAAGATSGGADVAGAVGRYVLPMTNWQKNALYRYIRIYVVVAGTIATGINFTAYLGKDD